MSDNFKHNYIQSTRVVRANVTIPAAAGTASQILALSADTGHNVIGCKILGKCSDGTDRGAIVVGDSTANLYQYVASGVDYYEPSFSDQVYSFVKAASGAAIANSVIVLYSISL